MNANDLELVFTGSALLGTTLLILSGLGVGRALRIPTRLLRVHLPFLRRDDATATPILLALGIFVALGRAEGRRPTSLRELIGRHAVVTVSIGAGARGTVRLTYDGAVQILPATADVGIARGREVEIVAVHGMAVTVRSLPPP